MRILLIGAVVLSLASFGLGSKTVQADYIDRAKAGKELAGGQLITPTHTQLVATVATEPVEKDKFYVDRSKDAEAVARFKLRDMSNVQLVDTVAAEPVSPPLQFTLVDPGPLTPDNPLYWNSAPFFDKSYDGNGVALVDTYSWLVDISKVRTFEELGIDGSNSVLFSAPITSVGLSVNSVPEPSSLIIWGTALLCLLPWLRKKFSK